MADLFQQLARVEEIKSTTYGTGVLRCELERFFEADVRLAAVIASIRDYRACFNDLMSMTIRGEATRSDHSSDDTPDALKKGEGGGIAKIY